MTLGVPSVEMAKTCSESSSSSVSGIVRAAS